MMASHSPDSSPRQDPTPTSRSASTSSNVRIALNFTPADKGSRYDLLIISFSDPAGNRLARFEVGVKGVDLASIRSQCCDILSGYTAQCPPSKVLVDTLQVILTYSKQVLNEINCYLPRSNWLRDSGRPIDTTQNLLEQMIREVSDRSLEQANIAQELNRLTSAKPDWIAPDHLGQLSAFAADANTYAEGFSTSCCTLEGILNEGRENEARHRDGLKLRDYQRKISSWGNVRDFFGAAFVVGGVLGLNSYSTIPYIFYTAVCCGLICAATMLKIRKISANPEFLALKEQLSRKDPK